MLTRPLSRILRMINYNTKEAAVGFCLKVLSRRAASSFELKKNFRPKGRPMQLSVQQSGALMS